MDHRIMLWKPKTPENIGHALRACRCYGARLAVVEPRMKLEKAKTKRRIRAVATHAANYPWRVVSEGEAADLMASSFVVPVELTDSSIRLETFEHPRAGLYVFGPEEGAVPSAILDDYGPAVQIPSVGCLNLAAAVAVVLYDRAAKL